MRHQGGFRWHYRQSVYRSESEGVPFEGAGYIAYDNARKMYIGTGFDNIGSGIEYLEGETTVAT